MCLRTIIHYWHWAVVMLSWMKDRNEKVQRMTVENNRIEEDDKMLNGIPLNKNVSNTEGRKTRRRKGCSWAVVKHSCSPCVGCLHVASVSSAKAASHMNMSLNDE
jgi:hypothetical protein